ncbi:glycosyltransferase family 4 protein [Candidatus Poribacteria bacterium]|nr:glycosyltransferase family 4 protein [Candidatus Poribacteria bacterium]
MIQFPVLLNAHKIFEHEGNYFIADMDSECVFEVSQVVLDILDICRTHTTTQVRDSLKRKYEESEINNAFRYLFQLQMAGILLQKRAGIEGDSSVFLGRIVVAPGFLDYLYQKSFHTRLVYHRLLKALCSELEIFIPIRPQNSLGIIDDFNWEEVNTFEVPDVVEINLARYYPSECDGLFSMPHSSFHDIPLAYSACIPTIYYVSSDEFDRQSIIDKYFLLREFDLLCADSWWMKDYLSQFVPSVDKVMILPIGVEEGLYERQDFSRVKSIVASAFQNERIMSNPVVLLFLPNANYENRKLAEILIQKHPEIVFIVVDNIDSSQLSAQPGNVEFFRIEDIEDYQAFPAILSASDIGYYSAVVGARSFYLSSALRCGVPMIISGHADPGPVGDFSQYIQVRSDQSPGDIVEMISENMTMLLGNRDMLDRYRSSALQIGKELTWASVAKAVVNLFVALKGKTSNRYNETPGPFAFFQYSYDPIAGELEPSAYEWNTYRKADFNKLIAQELMRNHTKEQVFVALEHICKDKKTAERILGQIS